MTCPYEQHTHRGDTGRTEGHVKTEAGTGLMLPKAKEGLVMLYRLLPLYFLEWSLLLSILSSLPEIGLTLHITL